MSLQDVPEFSQPDLLKSRNTTSNLLFEGAVSLPPTPSASTFGLTTNNLFGIRCPETAINLQVANTDLLDRGRIDAHGGNFRLDMNNPNSLQLLADHRIQR